MILITVEQLSVSEGPYITRPRSRARHRCQDCGCLLRMDSVKFLNHQPFCKGCYNKRKRMNREGGKFGYPEDPKHK